MDSVILIIILIALIESAFKKVDIFNEFIEGVKEGSKLLMTLFPTMMAYIMGNLFSKLWHYKYIRIIFQKYFPVSKYSY